MHVLLILFVTCHCKCSSFSVITFFLLQTWRSSLISGPSSLVSSPKPALDAPHPPKPMHSSMKTMKEKNSQSSQKNNLTTTFPPLRLPPYHQPPPSPLLFLLPLPVRPSTVVEFSHHQTITPQISLPPTLLLPSLPANPPPLPISISTLSII